MGFKLLLILFSIPIWNINAVDNDTFMARTKIHREELKQKCFDIKGYDFKDRARNLMCDGYQILDVLIHDLEQSDKRGI